MYWLGLIACVLFTVGLWTRISYAVLVAALLLTRLAWLQRSGGHDWLCPMAILVSLLPVPWGDGVSIDARRSATPVPPNTRSPMYGLAIWAPAVVMGLAFCGAAYAKLSTSGIAWITGGAVRYHFIEDADAAVTTWGLWIASHPIAAIAFSAGAVGLEAGWIAAVAARHPALRLLAGFAALSLFAGFYLFQGMLWLPWALWAAVWLPWDGWRTLPSAPLRGAPARVAAVALAVQIVASGLALEVEPLASAYRMYSGTYASPEDFEQQRRRKFQRIQATTGAMTVDVDGEAGDVLVQAVTAAEPGESDDLLEVLARLCDGSATNSVGVRVDLTRLNWTTPFVSRTTRTVTRTFACPPESVKGP